MAPASTKEEVDFPSGSNWGIPQLKKLNFPLQPESHPFEDLQWEHDLSKESLDILNELRLGFGLHKDEWAKCSANSRYKDFYDELALMLPRVQEKQLTPRKLAIRSNTKLPSFSDRQSSSPCSVKGTQRPAPPSAEKTTSMNISTGEAGSDFEPDLGPIPTPTLKRQRERFTRSPSLPTKRQREDFIKSPSLPPKRQQEDFTRSPTLPPYRPTPIPATTSSTAFCDMELSSSQTDSTFRSSELASSISDDEQSDGDRPESDVVTLIRSLVKRICEAHGGCHGYSFSVSNDVETLAIPICGDFPTSKPDLLIRMKKGRKTYSIVDYEVCILYTLILVSSSTKLWLQGKRLRTKMKKEDKFGQEVAHLLGRGNLMKSTIVSDKFEVRKPDHLLLPVYPLTKFPGISHFDSWCGTLHLHLPNGEQVSPSTPDQIPSSNFGTTGGASIWPRQSLRYRTKGSSCQYDIQVNA